MCCDQDRYVLCECVTTNMTIMFCVSIRPLLHKHGWLLKMVSVFQSPQQPFTVSNTPHYSQQDADQLSETSAFILLATQPPETLTYPTAPT